MKKDTVKKEEGLPEVAQTFRDRKLVIYIFLCAILIIIFGAVHFLKSDKKTIKPVEESYSIQQSSSIENTKIPTSNQTEPVNSILAQKQFELIQAKKNELQQRLNAPLMLVNNAASNKTEASVQASASSSDRNMQFLNQVSAQSTETAVATSIGSLNSMIAEGGLIHAILEPATNSDLPGFVRAIVSEPNYSEDGTQLLIPRGSRLLGQYKSGMLQGQSRIFMVWTRLITPSGISIQLGSPGVDSLGVAGIGADEINRHFWERFGTGALLSIIGAGAANVGVSPMDEANSASLYRTAIANSFAQSATQSMQQDSRIPPTLETYQGKPIIVFIAKDLNFQNAIKQTQLQVNIF
jgi:type IV secretion system protein VirB10